jgi:hypothetical protein
MNNSYHISWFLSSHVDILICALIHCAFWESSPEEDKLGLVVANLSLECLAMAPVCQWRSGSHINLSVIAAQIKETEIYVDYMHTTT